MPELSASFSSFRALTAVSARGLHGVPESPGVLLSGDLAPGLPVNLRLKQQQQQVQTGFACPFFFLCRLSVEPMWSVHDAEHEAARATVTPVLAA